MIITVLVATPVFSSNSVKISALSFDGDRTYCHVVESRPYKTNIDEDEGDEDLDASSADNLNLLMDAIYTKNGEQGKKEFLEKLLSCGQKSRFIDDLIKLTLLDVANGEQIPGILEHTLEADIVQKIKRSNPIKILHYQSEDEFYKYNALNSRVAYYFSPYDKNQPRIISTVGLKDGHSSFLHEATHAVMDMLHQNNAKPYADDCISDSNSYRKAITGFLLNIAKKINIDTKDLTEPEDIYMLLKTEKSILDLMAGIFYRYEKLPRCLFKKIQREYFYYPSSAENKRFYLETVIREYNKMKKDLGLSSEDIDILAIVVKLFYSYAPSELGIETIAYMIGHAAKGRASEKTLKEYFEPIMNYWEETVSKKYAGKISLERGQMWTLDNKTQT